MKKVYSLVLILVAGITLASAQEVIKGSITEPTTIKKGTDYLFDGLVWVENTTLTIEAGAVIKFKAEPSTGDNTSALIITRGAKIEANGTKDEPIIMTAESDDLSKDALLPTDGGQWGGLIVLGKAPVEKKGASEVQVEGIDSEEKRGLYGGSDAADNSGTIRYVSIRYTGVGIAPGSEIQGLTLGGVGSGTTIEYVDVYVSKDDGVEIFGGTVNLRYFSVAYAEDDAFDFDLGWRGNAQFILAIQRTPDGGYDHAGEWDGASPDDATLYTKPVIYNATFIGPGNDATGRARAILMRENYAGTLANSVLTDFPGKGLQVQDLDAGQEDSYNKLIKGELKIMNNTWASFSGVSKVGIGTDGLIDVTTKDANDNPVTPDHADCADLISHLTTNKNNIVASSAVNTIERNNDGEFTKLDPRTPTALGDLASTPSSWFKTVNYRGAFREYGGTWLDGWSTLAKYGVLSVPTGINEVNNTVDFSVYPNPSNGNFSITLPETNGAVSVNIVDVTGKVIAQYTNLNMVAGSVNVNTELTTGVYMIQVTTTEGTGVQRIIIE